MIKLRIEKIDGYNYNLRDEKNNYYKLNIEFYGLAKNPDINDELYIHEELLKYHRVNLVKLLSLTRTKKKIQNL